MLMSGSGARVVRSPDDRRLGTTPLGTHPFGLKQHTTDIRLLQLRPKMTTPQFTLPRAQSYTRRVRDLDTVLLYLSPAASLHATTSEYVLHFL